MAAARAAEIAEIEKNAISRGTKFTPWSDDSSSFTSASTHATSISFSQRMAPPLGMTVGPTLPQVDARDLTEPVVYHNYLPQQQYYQQQPQRYAPLLYENAFSDTTTEANMSRIGSPAPSFAYSRSGGNGGAQYQQMRDHGSPPPNTHQQVYPQKQQRPPSN